MIKGLMLLNNKVEDVEALATKALLTRAGFVIDTFTLEKDLIIETSYKTKVFVDYFFKDIKVNDYDFLILPGGKHVFNHLGNQDLSDLIIEFNNQNKLLAAICAAPLFLNEVDLLKNKNFVAFPSVVEEINGKYNSRLKVVKDENIITSRSAGTVYEFVFEIVETLKTPEVVNDLQQEIVY